MQGNPPDRLVPAEDDGFICHDQFLDGPHSGEPVAAEEFDH